MIAPSLEVLLLVVVVGLAMIVFGLDWADRRRNQRTLDLLTQFVTNPEVRQAMGVSDETPAGMTFVAPEPVPDPHVWLPYFVAHEITSGVEDWPAYLVERWERNELGETRYVETRTYASEPTVAKKEKVDA